MKLRIGLLEVRLDSVLTIQEEYEYPASTTHHPVTGVKHIAASGARFNEVTITIRVDGNQDFLRAALEINRQNRYGEFLLICDDGTLVRATTQSDPSYPEHGISKIVIQPEPDLE